MILRLDAINHEEQIDIESEINEIDKLFLFFTFGGYATFIIAVIPYIFSLIIERLSKSKWLRKTKYVFYRFILGKDIVE
jgi:hypothetical protein